MVSKSTIWTIAKIVGVAAVAALLTNYEQDNPDSEATVHNRLGKTLVMWVIGFALATAGGIAALATLPGTLTVLGAIGLAVVTIGALMGAGRDAVDRADDRFDTSIDAPSPFSSDAADDAAPDDAILNGETGEAIHDDVDPAVAPADD